MLGVGVGAVRQSIMVGVVAHIDAAAPSTHVHVDCMLVDELGAAVSLVSHDMQRRQSCDEELRQQAALVIPVWKRQVDLTGLLSSQVVVLLVEANNKIPRTWNGIILYRHV